MTRAQAASGTGHIAALPVPAVYTLALIPAVVMLATAAVYAAIRLLGRKRIAWCSCLDMAVRLAPPQSHGPGINRVGKIISGAPRRRRTGSWPPGQQQGWLVVLSITNPGLMPVRSHDFTIPLTFEFPGRQIHATQIKPAPAARAALPAPQLTAVPASGPVGGNRNSIQISGDFLLRPRDSYSIMILLSGMPADRSRHIQQHGSLPRGTITPCTS